MGQYWINSSGMNPFQLRVFVAKNFWLAPAKTPWILGGTWMLNQLSCTDTFSGAGFLGRVAGGPKMGQLTSRSHRCCLCQLQNWSHPKKNWPRSASRRTAGRNFWSWASHFGQLWDNCENHNHQSEHKMIYINLSECRIVDKTFFKIFRKDTGRAHQGGKHAPRFFLISVYFGSLLFWLNQRPNIQNAWYLGALLMGHWEIALGSKLPSSSFLVRQLSQLSPLEVSSNSQLFVFFRCTKKFRVFFSCATWSVRKMLRFFSTDCSQKNRHPGRKNSHLGVALLIQKGLKLHLTSHLKLAKRRGFWGGFFGGVVFWQQLDTVPGLLDLRWFKMITYDYIWLPNMNIKLHLQAALEELRLPKKLRWRHRAALTSGQGTAGRKTSWV